METAILPLVIGLILGMGLGAAGYRHMLKRDPETLEMWAKEIKAKGEQAERKLEEL